MEEHFGSNNTRQELVTKLVLSSFIHDDNLEFKAEDAFVAITTKDRAASYFLLRLDKPLDQYAKDHPVRRLFRQLDSPTAYGNDDGLPQYEIEDFVGE